MFRGLEVQKLCIHGLLSEKPMRRQRHRWFNFLDVHEGIFMKRALIGAEYGVRQGLLFLFLVFGVISWAVLTWDLFLV